MKSKINKAQILAEYLKDKNWINVPEDKKKQKAKTSIIRGQIPSMVDPGF